MLVVLVVIAFGEGAWYDFTAFDDPEWVSDNPVVQAGLSGAGIRYAFGSTILGHWAPLTVLSHMAVCEAFGMNAGAHHLVNVGLHALGAALLFLALRSLTGNLWRSAAVAAFFAVHPLRAESVMWITERKDVLSAVFFFLTLWAYESWTRRRGLGRYLLVVLLAACGLMAKSMLVTLPCVLLLLDFWPLGRVAGTRDARWRVVEKLPLFALAVVSAVIQYRIQAKVLAPLSDLGWMARIGNAVVACAVYVGQLFWAGSLSVFYPHEGTPPPWQIFTGAATLLAITALAWRYGREHRYLWIGWLWFLGMLVPVIGLVQAGEIARADRYTYLPHIGLLIMGVWGVADLTHAWLHRTRLLGSAAAIALAAAVIASRVQGAVWRNEETLWAHALAVSKDNYHAHYSLGMVAAAKRNFPVATAYLREAARLRPKDYHPPTGLGLTLLQAGDPEGALAAARIAVQMNPRKTAMGFGRSFKDGGLLPAAAWCFQEALTADPDDVEAALELALARADLGSLAESAQLYQSVLKRQPDRFEALTGLGHALTQMGRAGEAIPLLERALGQHRNDVSCLYALANARLMEGQSSLAADLYRKVLEKEPRIVEAQANLAWLLATSVEDSLRNGAEAVQWANRASDASGGSDPSILRILAAAHAEAGQYPDAVVTIERAVGLAFQQGDANLAARLGAQRDLYRHNTPLRVPIRPPGR